MSDATDDLELAEYFGTSTPVRDMDGTWFVYIYKGVKYRFRTVQEANEWAKLKGFKLSTTPPIQLYEHEGGVSVVNTTSTEVGGEIV